MPDITLKQYKKDSAVLILLRAMAVCWLLAKLICWKVWIKERLFPVVPLFEWCDWPSRMQVGFLAISIVLLIVLIINPTSKTALASLLFAEIISCLADQNRWQPWEYQYLFTGFIFLLHKHDTTRVITSVVFILAAIYTYSGLGKFNEAYLTLFWDNMLLERFFHVDAALVQKSFIHYSGYLTAVIETLSGAGLLFRRTRKISAWLLLIMHLLLLIFLGPWGLKYNIVIWPWNILMMAFLYIIFIQNNFNEPVIAFLWKGWGKLTVVCWGILPALNFAGVWDNYLSGSLYSGKQPQMAFCIKDSSEIRLLESFISKKDTYDLCGGNAVVNVQLWAMKEMSVPPYPEIRVYKKIESAWQKRFKETNTLFIYYRLVKGKEIIRLTEE